MEKTGCKHLKKCTSYEVTTPQVALSDFFGIYPPPPPLIIS